MNTVFNKNTQHIKKILAMSAVAIVLVTIFSFGTVYADTPAPAPATGGSLSKDAQCTAGLNVCVPVQADEAITGCKTEADCNVVTKYLNPIIKIFSAIAVIAVIIGIIYGGIQYSASGGDPQKVASAKRHIRNSVVALIAFFMLYAFLKFLIPGAGFAG